MAAPSALSFGSAPAQWTFVARKPVAAPAVGKLVAPAPFVAPAAGDAKEEAALFPEWDTPAYVPCASLRSRTVVCSFHVGMLCRAASAMAGAASGGAKKKSASGGVPSAAWADPAGVPLLPAALAALATGWVRASTLLPAPPAAAGSAPPPSPPPVVADEPWGVLLPRSAQPPAEEEEDEGDEQAAPNEGTAWLQSLAAALRLALALTGRDALRASILPQEPGKVSLRAPHARLGACAHRGCLAFAVG